MQGSRLMLGLAMLLVCVCGGSALAQQPPQPESPPSTAGAARQDAPAGTGGAEAAGDGGMKFDHAAAYQAEAHRQAEAEAASKAPPRFGTAGSNWLTLSGGIASDFDSDEHYELAAAYSHFLADELEFSVELGGWYFDQIGENTGGVSGIMYFRWHAWHDPAFDWSAYLEAGIGLLAGFDEVPDGSTGLKFAPRAGLGFTKQIAEDGTRLQIGGRWHHLSNGRFEGDARNESRDCLMVYAGLIIPLP